MYFAGNITVDPSSLTELHRVPPTKAFGKFLHFITAGLVKETEEVETFTAVSVLQQLNVALRALGITNIVRLAKDRADFYYDKEGRKDDLKEAVAFFEQNASSGISGAVFERLTLVLEHHDDAFDYLIQIGIQRRHTPGTHPVSLNINATLRMFGGSQGGPVRDQVRNQLSDDLSTTQVLNQHQVLFDTFVAQLAAAVGQALHADAVHQETKRKIIRPKKRYDENDVEYDDELRDDLDPLFFGYHGFTDSFAYAWMWSEIAHDCNSHVADVCVVDEGGVDVMEVGAAGFSAGDNNALDPSETFEAPASDGVTLFSDSDYSTDTGVDFGIDTSSWSDSGSSCGSSCGGGCGGCGGD